MGQKTQPIDDHTLASFIAGTLPAQRRREVAAYLARDPRMRELLHMAYEAMETTRPAEEAPQTPPVHPLPAEAPRKDLRLVVPDPAPARPRPARPRAARRYRLGGYVAAAVVVIVLGLGVWQTLIPSGTPGTDPTVRGDASEAMALSLPTTLGDLAFSWSEVPGADHYLLVIWDPDEAVTVARHQVETHRIVAGDTFARSLEPLLEAGRPYAARVDAFDAQNRLLVSSGMVEFSLRR